MGELLRCSNVTVRDVAPQLPSHRPLPRLQSPRQQQRPLAGPLGLNSCSHVIGRGSILPPPPHLLTLHLTSPLRQLLSLPPLPLAGRLKPPYRQMLLFNRPSLSGRPSLPLNRQELLLHPQQWSLTRNKLQLPQMSLRSVSALALMNGSRLRPPL